MDKEKITEHGYQESDDIGTETTMEELLKKMKQEDK